MLHPVRSFHLRKLPAAINVDSALNLFALSLTCVQIDSRWEIMHDKARSRPCLSASNIGECMRDDTYCVWVSRRVTCVQLPWRIFIHFSADCLVGSNTWRIFPVAIKDTQIRAHTQLFTPDLLSAGFGPTGSDEISSSQYLFIDKRIFVADVYRPGYRAIINAAS